MVPMSMTMSEDAVRKEMRVVLEAMVNRNNRVERRRRAEMERGGELS